MLKLKIWLNLGFFTPKSEHNEPILAKCGMEKHTMAVFKYVKFGPGG